MGEVNADDGRASTTDMLLRASTGDEGAVAEIFPIVYDELRRLARSYLGREAPGRTLGTTELVHEAYLRLIDSSRVEWSGRAHFIGIAASAMRRILVDRARARHSLKRGGSLRPIALDAVDLSTDDQADLLLSLDDALQRLRSHDERQARVVECRFFGGLTTEETAEVLGIAVRTAKRDWVKAKSWLYRELYGDIAS